MAHYKKYRPLGCWIFLIVNILLLLPRSSALARQELIDNLGLPYAVEENKEELKNVGCQTVPVTYTVINPVGPGAGFGGTQRRIRQPSIEIPDQLSGEINLYLIDPVGGVKNEEFTFCPASVRNTLHERQVQQAPSWWEVYIIWALSGIIRLVAWVGVFLLNLAAKLLGYLLGAKFFITHPFVRTGWPFVQGLANLGFILALLFIAFATTLRLNIGGGIRRMLPRLLIAALLINFSLVISGLIIDFSRVLMAIMVRLLSSGNLENLGLEILNKSGIVRATFNITGVSNIPAFTAANKVDDWRVVIDGIVATMVIWGLAAAMIIIAVGLLVRYIALILLLILSPLAYLFVALPNMDKLADRWWHEFLKYVFYGPVALFVLLLLAQVGNVIITSNQKTDRLLDPIVSVAMTAAMCVAAATAGKYLGVAGSSATVSFVKNAPKAAWRRPGLTGAVVGGLATGGVGGIVAGGLVGYGAKNVPTRVGREVANQARDFAGVARGAAREIGKKYVPWAVPAKRDDKNKLKEGQTSVGKRLGQTIFNPINPDEKRKAQEAQGARDLGDLVLPGMLNTPEARIVLAPARLETGHVAKALGDANINVIVRDGTQRQRMAIMKNKDYIRGIKPEQYTALQQAVEDSGAGEREKTAAIDQLLKTIDEIRKT